MIRAVVLWESLFADLAEVSRCLRLGRRVLPRGESILAMPTLGRSLRNCLGELKKPAKLLLVVHGDQGQIVLDNGPIQKRYLDREWWDGLSRDSEIYAFGCETARCAERYELNGILKGFLGYKSGVRFVARKYPLIGLRITLPGRRLLRRIGELFLKNEAVDEQFRDGVLREYDIAMNKVSASYRRKRADRLSLIFLEEQIQGLQPHEGASR